MADDNRVVLRLDLDTDTAQRNLKRVENSFGILETSARRLAATFAAVFSIGAIRSFASAAKEAWNVQLEAETKLETILGRNLHATNAQIQATKDWASALQRVGVIGDEIQLSGLQELSTYIENADSLKTMNVVLNDMLAQQYGLHATAESAVTISTMLGKVLEGQTSALSRYGYSFTEAQEALLKYGTEEQRVATLAEVVEASVGGMNEALAQTPAGRLKQLENDLSDIKEHFGQAITNLQTLFLPLLNKVADVLNTISLHAVAITEYFGNLLGVDLSNNIAAAASDTDALTASLEEAQTAAENLGSAGFDDFNVIGAAQNSAGTVESPTLDSAPILTSAQQTASEVQNVFSEYLGGIDFSRLRTSLDGLKASFEPLAGKAWDGLKWLWDEILQPMGEWVIEEAAPAAIGLLSAALDDLNELAEPFKPYGQWLWDEFLKPLGEWTGDIIVSGLEGLTDWLRDVGDWISEHPDEAVYITTLAGAFSALALASSSGGFAKIAGFAASLGSLDVTIGVIAAGIVAWGYVITEVSENWDDIMDVIGDSGGVFGFLLGWVDDSKEAIEEFFSFGDFGEGWLKFWESIGETVWVQCEWIKLAFTDTETFFKVVTEVWKVLFGKFCDWFSGKFSEARAKLNKTFENLGSWFGGKWDNVRGVFAKADSFFSEKFGASYDKVKKAFSTVQRDFANILSSIKAPFQNIAAWFHDQFHDAWQRVLDVFSSGGVAFEGIKEGISGVFKETVNKLIDGINNVVAHPFNAINDALQVVRDVDIFGNTWFKDLPSISVPVIPRLARGGLVSQPTLAMVGDNPNARNDPEVVSPLSKLRGMISERGGKDNLSDAKLSRMIQLLETLITEVQNLDLSVNIGDREIHNSGKRYERRVSKMKGDAAC